MAIILCILSFSRIVESEEERDIDERWEENPIFDDLFRKDPKIPNCGHSQKGLLLASGGLRIGKLL